MIRFTALLESSSSFWRFAANCRSLIDTGKTLTFSTPSNPFVQIKNVVLPTEANIGDPFFQGLTRVTAGKI